MAPGNLNSQISHAQARTLDGPGDLMADTRHIETLSLRPVAALVK